MNSSRHSAQRWGCWLPPLIATVCLSSASISTAGGYDYCWSEIRESRSAAFADEERLKAAERMVILGFFVEELQAESPDSFPPCSGAKTIRGADSKYGRVHECTMPNGTHLICLGPYCSPELSGADYDSLREQFQRPAKICRGFVAQDVFHVAQWEDADETMPSSGEGSTGDRDDRTTAAKHLGSCANERADCGSAAVEAKRNAPPLTARSASRILSEKTASRGRTDNDLRNRNGIYLGSAKRAFRVHVPHEFGAFTTGVISARKVWRNDVESLRKQANLLDGQYCNEKMGSFFVYTFVEGPYLKEFGSKIPWETLSEYCYTQAEGLPTLRVSSERIRGLDGQSKVQARQQLVMVGSVRSGNKRRELPHRAFAAKSTIVGTAPIQLKFEEQAFLPTTFTARDMQLPAVRNPIFIDPSGLLILARAMGPAGLPDGMTVYVFFDGEANLVSIETEALERLAGDHEQPYRVVARREGHDLATIDIAGDARRTIRELQVPLVRNALGVFKQ